MAEPFLYYLTVFKLRVGALSLVLGETGFAHQPMASLERKLRAILDQRSPIDVGNPSNSMILQYLTDKKLSSGNLRRTGRYRGYSLSQADGTWAASDQAKSAPYRIYPSTTRIGGSPTRTSVRRLGYRRQRWPVR